LHHIFTNVFGQRSSGCGPSLQLLSCARVRKRRPRNGWQSSKRPPLWGIPGRRPRARIGWGGSPPAP
jgi:hypothetical protein